MNENENIVVNEDEQNPEQVEQSIEQTAEETHAPKMFTQDEVNEIVGKAKARARAKIEKDYQRKYGGLEDVLRAGTGKQSVEEMTDTFAEFYRKKGVQIPDKPNYSARDIEVLAKAEADEIIGSGFDEVVEEVDRLAAKGVANMTPREKAVFKVLAEHRQSAERNGELSKLGVTEDVYNSAEFRNFASKFNSNTPIKDIYDIYAKTKPKKEYKTMGSMKQNPNNGVKDYYTPEEIDRLTEEDLDVPGVWDAVRRSMTGR